MGVNGLPTTTGSGTPSVSNIQYLVLAVGEARPFDHLVPEDPQAPVSPSPLPEVLTTVEVAALLRVTPRHIHALTERGILKPVRLGRAVRFLRRSVMAVLADLECETVTE